MIKRIVAILLALLMCAAFVGCAGDGAPDGMKNATTEGQPFKLYVPDSWSINTTSGVSSAYLSTIGYVSVSARYHTPENPEMTLDEYVAARKNELSLEFADKSFALITSEGAEGNEAVILGKESNVQDARQILFTAKIDEAAYTFRQIIAKYKGDFIILSFTVSSDTYDAIFEDIEKIREEFVCCDKPEYSGDSVTDKKTPEGMKIASSNNLEYRLYVPADGWTCDSESGKAEAYAADNSNVAVTSYSPSTTMTAREYWAMAEGEYKKTFGDKYEYVGESERKVADRDAVSYTYVVSYGGERVKIMQTVLVYNGVVYSITYSALEANFEAHTADVNKILDVFIFR
ncbi:MAG: hypothetical protein E7677_02780 [Ruminococcaceae bacterium]|nr:hypothetical protein [Oscillospiraceae bacterium]